MQSLKYEIAYTSVPHDLYEAVRTVVEELDQIGAEFIQSNPETIIVKRPQGTGHKGGSPLRLHAKAVSPADLAKLVNLRDSVIFWRGLRRMAVRLGALGWSFTVDSSQSNRPRVAISTGNQCGTIYFNETPDDLKVLQRRVELQELANDLRKHANEFDRAGILLEVDNDRFIFTLRENDPSITRRLTRANVDTLIAIARAIYGQKS